MPVSAHRIARITPGVSMKLETQAAFARRLGKDKSHVTRLKQAGRLVLRDGQVDVEASLDLLKATESPLARDEANRERLAEARAEQTVDLKSERADAGLRRALAQAEKMEHDAAMAGLERKRLEGELVPVADVRRAAASCAAAIRQGFESLPDRHAAELAGAPDEQGVHALLAEAIERELDEASRALRTLFSSEGNA